MKINPIFLNRINYLTLSVAIAIFSLYLCGTKAHALSILNERCSGNCPEFEEFTRNKIARLGINIGKLEYTSIPIPIIYNRKLRIIRTYEECAKYCQHFRFIGASTEFHTVRKKFFDKKMVRYRSFLQTRVLFPDGSLDNLREIEFDNLSELGIGRDYYSSEEKEYFKSQDGKYYSFVIAKNFENTFEFAVFFERYVLLPRTYIIPHDVVAVVYAPDLL